MATRVPSAVLRNKGVPVDVVLLDGDQRVLNDDESPRVTQAWVRFDANAMADMEEVFGSLDAFDDQARKAPTTCIRKALAIVWGVSPKLAGLMMLDGRQDDYATTIAVALALANGVDPQEASDLLEEGVKAVSEARKERSSAVRKLIAEDRRLAEETTQEETTRKEDELVARSPGTSGGPNGSVTATPSTSSGA